MTVGQESPPIIEIAGHRFPGYGQQLSAQKQISDYYCSRQKNTRGQGVQDWTHFHNPTLLLFRLIGPELLLQTAGQGTENYSIVLNVSLKIRYRDLKTFGICWLSSSETTRVAY